MEHHSQYPSTFYRVSLKAVIRDEQEKVLLCKEGRADTWNLPGGGWDHGETDIECLRRELKEEVNYDGDIIEAKPRATATTWLESKQAWLLWIVYDVVTADTTFSPGVDSSEVAFMHPRQLETPHGHAEQWIHDNL